MCREILKTVLASLDDPLSASFTFDDICGWPECMLRALESGGILNRGGNAQTVVCDGCGEACVEDVEFSRDGDGSLAAYVICGGRCDIGRVRVAPERL